jgi:hypothetical protein
MLICYVIAHTLWVEIRTPEDVIMYNVDTINYISENAGYPGELLIATNDAHRSIYLENTTINDFKTCIENAEYQE